MSGSMLLPPSSILLPSEMEHNELLVLAHAYSELQARQSDCPIAHADPSDGQKTFLRSLLPIVMALCGNRWGKTHALVMAMQAAALGYRPWEVPELMLRRLKGDAWTFPPRSEVPPDSWVRRWDGLPSNVPARLICVSGLALARGIGEIIQGKWAALWPKQVPFKPYLGPLGAWQKIVLTDVESEIYFGSASQEQLAFEGFAADHAFFDEPIPKRVYTSVRRGLIDRKGRLYWSMTPLGDSNMAWVAADLIENENPDVELIRGSSWDNKHVDREALTKFFNDPTLSAEERHAREHGEIAVLGRRIVTTFSAESCVLPPSSIPAGTPIVHVCDPHHSRRPFMVWAATPDSGETYFVFREWPAVEDGGPYEKLGPSKITLHDLAGLIKTIEGRENVVARVCDPSFGRQKAKVLGTQHQSFVDLIGEYDLRFDTHADNDIERGIQRLRDAFKTDLVTRKPRLLISSTCKNLIRALSFWSYEQARDGELKVSEAYKDPVDCLRYLLGWHFPVTSEGWSYTDEES